MLLLFVTLTQAAQENLPTRPDKTVVLIGNTGVGKSLFGNLLNDSVARTSRVFETGGTLDSTTFQCIERRIQLMTRPRELRATIGNNHGTQFDNVHSFGLDHIQGFLTGENGIVEGPTDVLVVDTPGLGDGKDNIRMIADKIKDLDSRYNGVDRFIIVVNGKQPVFDMALQQTFQQFQLAFTDPENVTECTKEWLRHVTFVFTRWGYSREQKKERRQEERPSEDVLKREFNTKVAGVLGLPESYIFANPVPCVFIDTLSAAECLPISRPELLNEFLMRGDSLNEAEESMVRRDSDEYLKYVEQLAILREQIAHSHRFPCSHVSAAELVRKRLDAGNFAGISEIRCTCDEFTGVNMREYEQDALGDIRGPGYKCRYCTNFGHRYATDLAVSTREGMRVGGTIGYGGGAIAGIGLSAGLAYSLGVGMSIGMCLLGGWIVPVIIVAATGAAGGLAGGTVGAAAGAAGAIPAGLVHAAAYDTNHLTDAPEEVRFADGTAVVIIGRQNHAPFHTTTAQMDEIEMTGRH